MEFGVGIKFHGTFKVPWNSIEFHGTSLLTWKSSMEFHGTSGEFHGIPWNSMELWNIDINKFRNWGSVFHCFLYDFMSLYIRQSISSWNIEIFQFQSNFLVPLILVKWRYSILNGGLLYTYTASHFKIRRTIKWVLWKRWAQLPLLATILDDIISGRRIGWRHPRWQPEAEVAPLLQWVVDANVLLTSSLLAYQPNTPYMEWTRPWLYIRRAEQPIKFFPGKELQEARIKSAADMYHYEVSNRSFTWRIIYTNTSFIIVKDVMTKTLFG